METIPRGNKTNNHTPSSSSPRPPLPNIPSLEKDNRTNYPKSNLPLPDPHNNLHESND